METTTTKEGATCPFIVKNSLILLLIEISLKIQLGNILIGKTQILFISAAALPPHKNPFILSHSHKYLVQLTATFETR